MRVLLLNFLTWLLFSTTLWADVPSPWYTQQTNHQIVLQVDLFLSTTCAHCKKADAFFRQIEPQIPWLHVNRHVINESKPALIRFNEFLMDQGMEDFAVPSVFFCNARWVGFVNEKTTGKELLQALRYCQQQIEKKGELTSPAVATLKRWAHASLFDSAMVDSPTVPQYISVIALTDAFNPCALFCFTGFLALLFLQNNQKQTVLVGGLFILVMGVMHYLQQSHTSAFFEWLPWFRLPAIGVGLGGIFLAYQSHLSNVEALSLRVLFIFSLLLAIVLSMYQQTCLMNWGNVFNQWLSNQPISNTQAMRYQWTYQALYILPLLISLIFYIALKQRTFLKPWKPFFKDLGFYYLLAIALILIFHPQALSHMVLSGFVLFGIPVVVWLQNKFGFSPHF